MSIPQVKSSREVTKEAILKQVEFYFGDSNYLKDKFLQKEASENRGWVPIEKICLFNRMKQYIDKNLVVEALRGSKELLEVNAEGTMVRRVLPALENPEAFHWTIYAKGFPDETPELQEKLEAFFQPLGNVRAVRLRRDKATKAFKHSAFVEFSSKEEAMKVSEMDLEYEGEKLLIMTKEAYVLMKCHEKGIEVKADMNAPDKTPRKFLLAFKNYLPTVTLPDAPSETEKLENDAEETAESHGKIPFRPLREIVEEKLGLGVKFIKFNEAEQGSGWIELKHAGAHKGFQKAESEGLLTEDKSHIKLNVLGAEVLLRELTPQEEVEYWNARPEVAEALTARHANGGGHRGRGRGRGGGGNKRTRADGGSQSRGEKRARV